MKSSPEWKTIFAFYIINKGIVPGIHKEFPKPRRERKTGHPFYLMGKRLEQAFYKKKKTHTHPNGE